ncbi:fluoride efflux transporter FluC [Leucobacter sp. USHLN153]|uniref:fluoride efflux transporter FluC n=1 Tax=Leucobacter sp. USHLN153 TaxID=3081268 RepID=UPI003015C430
MEIEPSATAPPSPGFAQHLRAALLVGAGGVFGTAARFLLSEAIPKAGGVPVGILLINLTGAFILGVLLEALALRGSDTGGRRIARLFFGTGVLGGYTTYSTLATDSALLIHDGRAGTAALYAVGTVLLGAVASVLGILLARRVSQKREVRS